MNKYLVTSLTTAAIVCSPMAQATNGYQLTGIGSHQVSLAGAVTANPGSAMTAISNPAGMARIGKRADFSLEMFMPDRFVDFTAQGGERSESAATQYGIPALGWTAPIDDEGGDVYFGGGMYGTSGMGADYGLTSINAGMLFEGYSAIQFWQMAPTVAWNTDKLSMGVSLNIDYQSVALKQAFYADGGTGEPSSTMVNIDLSRAAQAFGYGLTFGTLYDVTDQVTVGFSYKSKQSFPDLEYQLVQGDIQGNVGFGVVTGCPAELCPSGLYKLQLDFPAITSLGVAYSPVEALKISFDVKHIQWSDTLEKLTIKGPNGMRLDLPAGWADQTILAIGIEYSVNQHVRLRMGYNQADAPIDNADTFNNLILPATAEKHFAVGGDVRLSKFWDLGFHYLHSSQNTLTTTSPMPVSIGLEIDTFGVNLGYRF